MIVLPEQLVGESLTLLDESIELLEVHQRIVSDTDSERKTSGLIGRLRLHKHKLEEQAKEKPAEPPDPKKEPIRPPVPLPEEEEGPEVCVGCGGQLKTPNEWVSQVCAKCGNGESDV